MPLGKRKKRFSRQRYNTFSKPKATKRRTQSYRSTRVPRVRHGSGFNLENTKIFIHNLFTTREGWKKLGFAAIIFLGVIFALFAWYAKDLPTPNKINSRISAQSTQIFDRNGKLLYEIHGDQNRILADWNEIPQNCKNATIAIEDKDFYKHGGFSIMGIGRAFTGVALGDRSKGGGSTITQQFVKNALLTNERSYSRKIKEIIMAIEIEQMYKKDDILKMYLNEIPYGSNAYGIKVAAKTYFNKDLKNLNLQECAVLAAMPQAPTYYSPFGSNKAELMKRKDTVLDDMANQKMITKEEAKNAQKEVIAFSNNPYGSITAPHFVMYVKEKLVEKYGEKTVNEGGLKVYTTLDLQKQQYAEEAVATNVDKNRKAYNASNASLVAEDPKTGQILAMVGSRDFFNQDIDGNVNVSLMDRQPGSSFKPFAYATAWKTNNWGPGSVLYDLKTDFGGGYNPNNYDGRFRGPVTMRKALQNSLNIPAVKTLYIAGLDNVIDTAHAMGITTLNDKSQYGLSLVLGAGEVKLVDMVGAYGVFANNGVKQDPSWYIKIEDSKGKTIDEYKNKQGKRVLDPQISYLMNNVLSDDSARAEVFGAGGPLTLRGRPAAAKTGTTNDYKDAWTMGYTPSLVAGVWAGNNDNTPMTKAGGSIAAAPIWHDFMTKALAGTASEQFTRPSGIKTVTLDAITGKKPATGSKTVTDIFPSWYSLQNAVGATEVKINIITNKIVNDSCPPDQSKVETRTINSVTAEIPSTDAAYSRWFAPINAWAASSGYSTTGAGQIGQDTCPLNQGTPTISFTDLKDGDDFSSPYTVNLSISAPNEVQSVIVQIGSQTKEAVLNGSLYTVSFTKPSGSTVDITATVTDKIGQNASAKISVNVK
ncbi:MAG: transglycosylase domain-containing protein [Patescibacteria group bacterium]|nr:transglycosylase domain-containing protein [Patescibacteria group bacterium]